MAGRHGEIDVTALQSLVGRRIAERFGHLTKDRRKGLAQDVMELVLRDDARDDPNEIEGVVDRALTRAMKSVRRKRSVPTRSLRTEPGETAKVQPRRRPRQPRMPYKPKGLVPMTDATGRVGHIPVTVGDPPDQGTRFMADRVRRAVTGVLDGALPSPEQRERLAAAYAALFDEPPEHFWAELLVDEILAAKRAKLDWEARQATQAAKPHTPKPQSSIGLTLTPEGRKRYPNLPQEFRVRVRPVLEHTVGDRAIYAWVGNINGEEQILARSEVSIGGPEASQEAYKPRARAQLALVRVIERLGTLVGAPALPEYVLDAELVAWLVERAGFEGGGGPRGVLSAKRLRELIVDPSALASEMDSYGQRVAERLEDAAADTADRRFRVMAARLRESLKTGA